MIDDNTDDAVRRTFGAGKVQRIDLRAVEQAGDPKFLAIWLIKHKVAVKIADSHRAGEVRVSDLNERVGRLCIDERIWIADKHDLIAVVSDGYQTCAGDRTQQRRCAGQRG